MSSKIAEPRRPLPDSVPLDEFLAQAAKQPMGLAARYGLVAQARALLEGLYVHLALKRAMYAIDPVQRLRLLQRRLAQLGDLQFHTELGGAFRSLRDLHTVYQLPPPFAGQVATLGLLVETYIDPDGAPHYIVSKVDPALQHAGFTAGAELLAWNGVPIERAVELNAERQAGSNPDARLARALEALTLRPLRTSAPPDERWVLLGYRTNAGRRGETRIPWRVQAAELRDGSPQDPVSTVSTGLGIDPGGESTRQVKRKLFAPPSSRAGDARTLRSVLTHALRSLGGRRYRYLRLFSFNVSSARLFAEQVAAILSATRTDGLIIDIRGNPGGNISAAEGVLQLLSAAPVTPVNFSLATTQTALALCHANPSFRSWTPSIDEAVETGELYSQAFPLSDPEAIADGLPRYTHPKVLITDALCYSAADIFAAGFQDNGLGPVLGTAARTGAGGPTSGPTSSSAYGFRTRSPAYRPAPAFASLCGAPRACEPTWACRSRISAWRQTTSTRQPNATSPATIRICSPPPSKCWRDNANATQRGAMAALQRPRPPWRRLQTAADGPAPADTSEDVPFTNWLCGAMHGTQDSTIVRVSTLVASAVRRRVTDVLVPRAREARNATVLTSRPAPDL